MKEKVILPSCVLYLCRVPAVSLSLLPLRGELYVQLILCTSSQDIFAVCVYFPEVLVYEDLGISH